MTRARLHPAVAAFMIVVIFQWVAGATSNYGEIDFAVSSAGMTGPSGADFLITPDTGQTINLQGTVEFWDEALGSGDFGTLSVNTLGSVTLSSSANAGADITLSATDDLTILVGDNIFITDPLGPATGGHWSLNGTNVVGAGLSFASDSDGILFSSTTTAPGSPDAGVNRDPAGGVLIHNGDGSTADNLTCDVATIGSTSVLGSGPMLNSYIEVGAVGVAAVTTITVQGDYVEAFGNGLVASHNGAGRDCSVIDTDTIGFTYDGANERIFLINCTITTKIGGANDDSAYRFAVNDVTFSDTQVSRTHSNATDFGSVSLVWITCLQPGDEVSLYTTNLDSTSDITVQDSHFAVVGFQTVPLLAVLILALFPLAGRRRVSAATQLEAPCAL